MSKIGIIGAMELEVATLKKNMDTDQITKKAGMEFHEGNLKGMPVVVVQCGVGKVNAAMCVQILADLYDVTHIINTGVAGSLNPVLDIGDILVSKDAIQHDMDVTPLGYVKGQIPGLEQLAFTADEKLCKTAVEVCKRRPRSKWRPVYFQQRDKGCINCRISSGLYGDGGSLHRAGSNLK